MVADNRKQSPLEEQVEGDNPQLREYLTRMQDEVATLAPALNRLDMEALTELEGAFQKEMHRGLYTLKSEEGNAIMDLLSWIKGAHVLLTWIEAKQKMLKGC